MKKLQKFIVPVLIAVIAIVYGRSVNFEFTYMDDNILLLKNENVFLGDFSLSRFLCSSSNVGAPDAFYRPLQNMSFWVDTQIAGMNAWPFHVHNLLLFMLVSLMLYAFLRTIRLSHFWAFGFSLLYAVHPLFISAVSWIPARGDLQLAITGLASFILFIRYWESEKPLFLLASLIAWFFALLSKETAAVLPLLFVIYAYLYREKNKTFVWREKWGYVLAFVGVFVIWFVLRTISVDKIPLKLDMILAALQHFPNLFQQAFIPYDVNTLPIFSWHKTLIGLCIALILGWAYVRTNAGADRKRLAVIGAAIILLTILPLLLSQIEMLYHRLLLPAVGLILIIYAVLPEQWLKSKKASFVFGALALVFAVVTAFRLSDYRDYESYYARAIACGEGDLDQYYMGRGIARQSNRNFIEALEDYDHAIQTNPKYSKPYMLRGMLRAEFKDVKGGIEDITKAIELNGPDVDACYNRAKYYTSLGDFASAMRDYQTVLELNPKFPLAYNNIANLCLQQRDWKSAIENYNTALKLDPLLALGYVNRALAYYQQGNVNAALNDINKALTLKMDAKDKVMLYYRKAQLEYDLGSYYQALNDLNVYLNQEANDPIALELVQAIKKKIQP